MLPVPPPPQISFPTIQVSQIIVRDIAGFLSQKSSRHSQALVMVQQLSQN
jgi:hypothetical protein